MVNKSVTLELDNLAQILIETPVGYLQKTIQKILKAEVELIITDQRIVSGTIYYRNIIIRFKKDIIVRAAVTFDCKILPSGILSKLLEKQYGIGRILREENISVQRKTKRMLTDVLCKTLTRDYEIWKDNSIWFDIKEEIRLDLLNSRQNC